MVDNFAPIEYQQRWAGQGQRYWLNRQFWGGEGYPIFVFIGGEGEEKCTRLTDYMYMFNLARDHSALLVNVEHRFYGKSMPTADTSTKNLQYLSSSQALADLARVITHVKESLGSTTSKVVTVGGSYPGNLAAWFRLKYPSITVGSIASSAPLTAQTNFPEYMDVVAQALVHFSGQGCYNAMEDAANTISSMITKGSWAQLETDFQLCKPMSSQADWAIFMSDLMGNVQGTVQYNNEHNGVLNVTDICKIMTATSDNYQNFVTLQSKYRAANGQDCEDGNWADTMAFYQETSASRSWTYQTCNEFGYYQTTDSLNQPFSSWKLLNLDFYRAMCAGAFNGWKSDPQVHFMNEVYGDVHIAGTNIAFAAGTIDPWHALGATNVTHPLPQASEVKVYIQGTAHCHDLYAPANSDPQSLTDARKVIAQNVASWLR